MSGSNDQETQVSTDKLNEVNNNKAGLENNSNGLTAKKSLVKMSNREGSTRSLSCFKNPEMSSKELSLSEEMTLDMYHTNIESNTGLRKKNKTFSSKSTDEKINITCLENAKTEADDNFLNGKPMNGHYDSSPVSSSIENLKLSTTLGNENNEKNRSNQSRTATENFEAKFGENAKKNSELKRTDAVDNETKVDSMVKISNLMKHRENVAGIYVQENSERMTEVSGQQNLGGQQVKQKTSNKVKQKAFESEDNGRDQYDVRSQGKPSTEIHLVGPDPSPFHNSRDEVAHDQESVKKMREQFDSVGVVQELRTKHVSNSTESFPKSKQALEMKKSPPIDEQWSDNVDVSLYSKGGQTGKSESNVTVGMKNSRDVRQISPQDEAQRIKVKSYQNESKRAAIDSNFKTSDSLLMNNNLSPDEFVVAEKIHNYKNDPSLKGKVGERKEFFSSLGRRLDSEFVARGRHASDRMTKPKYFEYFEGNERDQSNRNLRGRTEANRRKIDREDMPEDRGNGDSARSLRHLYAVHSERSGKQNNSNQKNHSFGNLNENGEHDYLQPNEQLYQNDQNWYEGFSGINGNLRMAEDDNYIQRKTSRFTTRNNGMNGDLSAVSDDDKDSVGEYELQPKSGKSEIQVPSESAIQKMIEDDCRNPQKSTNTPVGINKSNLKVTSEFESYKPNGHGYYEEINETIGDTIDRGKQKLVKRPRGNGLNYGQIWYEEEDRKRSDRAPAPPPMRTETDYEYDDDDSADYANDNELDDEDDEDTTIRTITKTITRQVKQTIPSGIVTVAQEGGKKKTENHRITGTITAKKNKPRQTLEKNLVSGFINVEKETSHQPMRTPSRREHNIEVVTKINPNPSIIPKPHESRSLSTFDARNVSLPSQAFFRHEGLTENYSERMITTPVVETELGVDPELRDAKKTGSTYKITMNLNPSLLVSSRPASAVSNTNFISPPFSPSSVISQPNLISRHNSNVSSDAYNTHYMNGTLPSITPSVFSPPVQNAQFFHSNIPTHREQDRGSGSGTVVVSLTGASGNKKQVSPQSDVAFDLSLQGVEREHRAKNVSSLTVSNVKSSSRNEFSGRNIEEQIENKAIISSALNDVPDYSKSNWKQTERNHLQKSGVASHGYSPRKLISDKPKEERNAVQLSRSGPREVPADGGNSSSRPEILYSALDANRAKEFKDTVRNGTTSSKEQSRASQKIPEYVVTSETPEWKSRLDYSRRNGEMTDMSATTGEHDLTIGHENPLKSLDEDSQFDKEIEINKRHQSAFGRANAESYGTRKYESGGSSETKNGRRMEQINRFDLQTLLRGAAADSVKQRINIKRLGDKISNGPQISQDLKHQLAMDELPPSENDKVAEEISMNIDSGKVTMTNEILCKKTVPIYNSQDMYKTSSILLIRVIEVDLSVTPERKRLYDLIVGPDIEKRPLSENEKKELYKKFMALAEHSRKGLL